MSLHRGGRGPFHLTRAPISGGGPSPPSGYTCGAVSFDGATRLVLASVIASDSYTLLASLWFDNLTDLASIAPELFAFDAEGNFCTNLSLGAGDGKQANMTVADAGGVGGGNYAQVYSSTDIANGTWYNLLFSANTNHGAGQKVFQMYLNDVPVTQVAQDDAAAFMMAFSGKSLTLGTDTFGDDWTGYAADWWIAPDQYLDLSVTANRRKFIDATGKPVDLGENGETPTGMSPAIFCHIASAEDPTNFAANRGSGGGPFTITGTLTNAPSSPSD